MGIKDIVDGLAKAVGAAPAVDTSKRTLTDGSPITDDHRQLKANGQQKGYVVLSEEERKRGFVRPVRTSYVHVGRPAHKNPLRDLTPDEHARYDKFGYAKYEEYPPERSPVMGRFWTQDDLDKIDKGCGTLTTMGIALAETYARKPDFYGSTFCCGCGKHLRVGADGEFVWDGTNERVGT